MGGRPRQTTQAATMTWKVAKTGSLKQPEKGASKTRRGVVTLSMGRAPWRAGDPGLAFGYLNLTPAWSPSLFTYLPGRLNPRQVPKASRRVRLPLGVAPPTVLPDRIPPRFGTSGWKPGAVGDNER